ncbi:MAG: zf-TFIIB domain-containing protein [Deltaproteobacteria bacterium]|nr:zf-TFIIB domain-containing protein [Deltaproteobacteria bacterium]
MFCPKCRREEMKPETHKNTEIDRCPVCKGMFFEKGELERMIITNASADTFAFSAMSDAMDEVTAHCTRCDVPMKAHTGLADLRVDMCDTCGGIFLDQGELATLQLHDS